MKRILQALVGVRLCLCFAAAYASPTTLIQPSQIRQDSTLKFGEGALKLFSNTSPPVSATDVAIWANGNTLKLHLNDDTNDTVALLSAAQTLTSKTLTSPVINGTVTTTGLTMPAFDMGGAKITGLATPTLSTDAATKGYADSLTCTTCVHLNHGSPESGAINITGNFTLGGDTLKFGSQAGGFVYITGTKAASGVLGDILSLSAPNGGDATSGADGTEAGWVQAAGGRGGDSAIAGKSAGKGGTIEFLSGPAGNVSGGGTANTSGDVIFEVSQSTGGGGTGVIELGRNYASAIHIGDALFSGVMSLGSAASTTHIYSGLTVDLAATFSSGLSAGSQKITSLANGTASTDAVNKGQLDAAVAGVVTDLPGAYAGGSAGPQVLALDSTRLGITIKDNATPITGDLFSVTDSSGALRYFQVGAGGFGYRGDFAPSLGTFGLTGQIVLENSTASTAGNNRVSPGLVFAGRAYASSNDSTSAVLLYNSPQTVGGSSFERLVMGHGGNGATGASPSFADVAYFDLQSSGIDFSPYSTAGGSLGLGNPWGSVYAHVIKATTGDGQDLAVNCSDTGAVTNCKVRIGYYGTSALELGDASIPTSVLGTLGVTGAATFTSTISASNFSGSSSGTNTGDLTLAAVGSSPSANGATLSGQALTLQPADATHPGVITTATQVIPGQKQFSSTLVVSAGIQRISSGSLNIGTSSLTTSMAIGSSSSTTTSLSGNTLVLDATGGTPAFSGRVGGVEFIGATASAVTIARNGVTINASDSAAGMLLQIAGNNWASYIGTAAIIGQSSYTDSMTLALDSVGAFAIKRAGTSTLALDASGNWTVEAHGGTVSIGTGSNTNGVSAGRQDYASSITGGDLTLDAHVSVGTPHWYASVNGTHVIAVTDTSFALGTASVSTAVQGPLGMVSYADYAETTDPAAPAANHIRCYARSNGVASPGHRTQYVCMGSDGNVSVISETNAD